MKKGFWLVMLCAGNLFALPQKDVFQSIVDEHHHQYSPVEYFSALQVSIKLDDKISTYVSGQLSQDKKSRTITKDSLFNIGSITKSFTSSLMLLAQREHTLPLSSTLDHYLPQYAHWGKLTLASLLDMSSGLPNYSNSPTINYLFKEDLKRFWSPAALIDLVYRKPINPPLKQGFFYSNTGYILAGMILESLYKKPYKDLLTDKILNPLHLADTFYPLPSYSPEVANRLVQGYSYNIYDNPELTGRNVTENNLSWAGAAGALVANSSDVIQWVVALFEDPGFLSDAERVQLTTMISASTGKPLAQTNAEDNKGFGLGVIQAFDKDMGRYWFYEGETLGYRALYMYSPCNKVVISALFNSAVNEENDHGGLLIKRLFMKILETNPNLRCS